MAKRREPLSEEDKRKLNKDNFRKLAGIFKFILPYKWVFLVGMIFLVLSSVTLLAFPYVAGKLIDVASGKSDWIIHDINTIALGLVALLFAQSVFSFFRVYLFALVNEQGMRDIRVSVYSKLMVLPMRFFDNRRAGELMSRITSDVSMLQDTFSVTLAEFFRQIATLIIGIVVLIYTTPKLTLFMLATFPVLVLLSLFFGRYIRKLSKTTQDELASANVVVEETLQAIQVVKAFTSELFEVNRYKRSLNRVVQVALRTAKFRGGFISFIIFALFGGIVAVMWYGARLVEMGDITSGDMVSFVLFTIFIGGSIFGLGDLYGQVQRAIGASERILEIIGQEGEMDLHAKTDQNTSSINGAITFQNVSFSYPSRKDVTVLENLNLTIQPGEKIALVGKSGAGKSTIVQLLLRFYDQYTGNIKVDGNDIDSFEINSYRKNIGIVPQEVILFGGSIKENIGYGKPDASDEEVKEAARKANALGFIENFPEGFETLVGERGVKLSGGQRQRIAIARAMLKDPKILILDEATSSLDAASEVQVQGALDELMKNRTTIVIAHRLATIRKVDCIYVIDKGQVIETGNHQELSQKENGIYSNLVKLQFDPA